MPQIAPAMHQTNAWIATTCRRLRINCPQRNNINGLRWFRLVLNDAEQVRFPPQQSSTLLVVVAVQVVHRRDALLSVPDHHLGDKRQLANPRQASPDGAAQ